LNAPRPDIVPVFPLPNVVLFPNVTLPLLVFEPRYRQMVEDLLQGDRWLAVPLLRPGRSGSAAAEEPEFETLAGAGRIGRYTRLPDGRMNIVVEGEERVRLTEVPSDRPYRRARAVAAPEDMSWLSGREAVRALREILVLGGELGVLEREAAGKTPPRGRERRALLLNQLASVVLAEPAERQAMLAAPDYRERAALVLRQLKLASSIVTSLGRLPRPENPQRN
jgi:Lon protease-like protein